MFPRGDHRPERVAETMTEFQRTAEANRMRSARLRETGVQQRRVVHAALVAAALAATGSTASAQQVQSGSDGVVSVNPILKWFDEDFTKAGGVRSFLLERTPTGDAKMKSLMPSSRSASPRGLPVVGSRRERMF